jgi:pyridoxal phosphate enzyme (YggS family)
MTRAEEIARNLDAVKTRIRLAEKAAGRPEGAVTLVAVSKTMPAEDIAAARAAGQIDFGENYAQELRDKRQGMAVADVGAGPGIRWHFIGPLQSNKVKYVVGHVALIHSLDTPELLVEAERRATLVDPKGNVVQDCLVQVNVAGERQKRGVAPEALGALLDQFAALPHLRCVGLMVIPPLDADVQASRVCFVALRRLAEAESARSRPGVSLGQLSMGMSHDLEPAIAEGATLVRVGTAIFGPRRAP